MPEQSRRRDLKLLRDLRGGQITAHHHGLGGTDLGIIQGTRSSTFAPPGGGGGESGASPIPDNFKFHLGQRTQDMEQEPSIGS